MNLINSKIIPEFTMGYLKLTADINPFLNKYFDLKTVMGKNKDLAKY